jgi:hypothetical protein
MNEPKTTNVEISKFNYDPLFAGETLSLKLDLDFNSYDFSSEESHLAFMFKILDNKNFILGNAKQDNLILFVNLNPEEIPQDTLLGMASMLLDEGYSQSFDRCLKAARCANGEVERARDLLSKVMITEN